jgi:uncharacterized damage-inducible protein DinB
MIGHSLLVRLESQLDSLPFLISLSNLGVMTHRPTPNKWSAHENLAHLARYHEVFLERLERILKEDRPTLPRYRAEEDESWPVWAAKSPTAVLSELQHLRKQLIETVGDLSPEHSRRSAIHPVFGEMSVSHWLEFFLLHEEHHLYVVWKLIHETANKNLGLQ